MLKKYIKKYFSDGEIDIMADAIVDHRASLEYETRSVYGRIVSSTDREISIDNDRNEFMKKELEVIKKYNLELPNQILMQVKFYILRDKV